MFAKKINRNTALLLSMLLLNGCAKNFVVESELPPPLIETVPITARIVYSDEFKNYVYQEKDNKRDLQSINLGNAQVNMFDKVFSSLFTLTEAEEQANILVQPDVLDFQYTTPGETNLRVFEVWLKYRLKISGQQGENIADWVVKGYGKAPTTRLGSTAKSLNNAANVALRDIGAQLAVGLPTQSAMQDYLSEAGVALAKPVNVADEDQYQNKELDNYAEPISANLQVLPEAEISEAPTNKTIDTENHLPKTK